MAKQTYTALGLQLKNLKSLKKKCENAVVRKGEQIHELNNKITVIIFKIEQLEEEIAKTNGNVARVPTSSK